MVFNNVNNTGTPLRILVLDANQRSALAVTRSLGAGTAEISCADSEPDALAANSRFCRQYLQCPDAGTAPEQFLLWLEATCKKSAIDWVFPVTEISSQLILMSSAQLPSVRIPFAPLEKVMALADKGNLVRLARASGVAVPATGHYNRGDEIDIAAIGTWPVVIKPTQSKRWLGDRWLDSQVHIAHSAAELEGLISGHDYLREFPVLLQEFIAGSGGGLFALYDEGREVAVFAHRRIREKPPWGGVSVLSESADAAPALHVAATKLLQAVDWHGVAMVEFRVDARGRPWLMEVNTRFWGSLQLAIDAGVDFPGLLLQVATGAAPPAVDSYHSGRRLRWFLGDVDALYIYLKSAKYSFRQKIVYALQFVNPFTRWARHEVARWSDPGPGWYEVVSYIRQFAGGR